MNRQPLYLILFISSLLLVSKQGHSQEPADGNLYKTIAALDTRFFTAYNDCDLKTAGQLLNDSLEFYHDKGGLTIGRDPIIESLKQNICGKVRRELVPGTMQVFAMDKFGAIESGEHYFYDILNGNKGNKNKPVGRARFFHLWRQHEGQWQLTRIISYDHKPVE